MQKLVCDRCGLELTDREDINLALEGKWAWEAACRAHGVEPRGILPCKNYVRCGGEIVLVTSRRQRLLKFLSKR
ncbi:hypothetical protein ES703_104956 [subsurface metagenome]|jgi:hypothetical protein